MTRVFLIRHAEAEGNLYRRVQGRFDGQITAQGELQISALAERFREEKIDYVYSSDLTRAMSTARAVTKYNGLEIEADPRLREINMGVWENLPWGSVEYGASDQIGYFMNDPDKWSVEGSESFPELTRRIRDAVLELAARHDGRTIAIVSHGMAIRSLLCHSLGVSSARVSEIPHGDNTSVALLNVDETNIDVVYYNDNSHLPEEISTFARQTWWKRTTGADRNNLRFLPLILPAEKDMYMSRYADAWISAHGSLDGYDGRIYYARAMKHLNQHPQALMKALIGEDWAGLIELDTERALECAAGWVSFLYIDPEYRGRSLGIQLIGHAVTVFRSLGRKSLRLHAAVSNTPAIDFYKRYGFKILAREQGAASPLYLMEMQITPAGRIV